MVQTDNLDNKILIICGATASSKTALAVECAKLLGSEVLSADSMNIYKGLDIGTAKPDAEEMQGVKHHLIDVVFPKDAFTVSDYKRKAEPILRDLIKRKKIPVICGGTGFYINSLLYDLSYGNGTANPEIREKYKKLAVENGNLFVYNILKKKDPTSAEKLHYNDVKRVIRALEILENGIKKSDIKDEFKPKYNYSAYCIDYPREVLYERINKRVDLMIKKGLVDEVRRLVDQGLTAENQSMQGIGYKEILSYLDGKISLEEAVDLIKLNTRHYAKRQITYFRKMDGLKRLAPAPVKDLAKRIVQEL